MERPDELANRFFVFLLTIVKTMPKTKTAPKKVVKKVVEKDKKDKKGYKLEAHLNDEVFKYKGNTLLETLQSFVNDDDFPLAVKTKVFLKYSKGEVERHKLMNVSSARTIFKRLRFDEDQANFLAEKLEHELSY